MKKLLLFLMLIAACVSASAQDVIVKKDGSTVLCKIIKVDPTEVVYLKWSDLKGPQYIMDSSLVSNINYQDGRQDKLSEQTMNSYAPGIQQTGDAQYNDNALLALDRAKNNISPELKKAKKLKIIGWTVGGVLILGGITAFVTNYLTAASHHMYPVWIGTGCVLIAGGTATTIGCLIKAHQIEKDIYRMAFNPIIQHDFRLGNNHTLSASVDIIRDNKIKHNAVGLGLQFNF